ncbi:hypothetical protein BGY98DRAFT_1083036 [Russula aff. rugulosa BPL654]|nr:hypothetical protein BGY98DRAFT_1083036 [Russula aff. rugulosa BPL654]
MYLDKAIEDDKKMVERWKSTTDGILIFTGLFSAVVAVLLGLSVPTIQRNPQDTSSFYLAHIYQQLSAQSNGSQPLIPSDLTNPIEPFIPPTSAVWATGLWFLSLVISLTCALIALLLQQWARRYLQVAYSHPIPHNRARIRAFYKHGVKKLGIPLHIEVVPVMLHMSLFLFFVGLSVYLSGVHRTIFKVVTAWIGLCILLYAYLTVLPVIHKNNPCSSPLSSSFSFCFTGMRYVFFRLLQRGRNQWLAILTSSFRIACARQQRNTPSKWIRLSTIIHYCGHSGHWRKIRISRNSSKASLAFANRAWGKN